jgi:hypothetical protein
VGLGQNSINRLPPMAEMGGQRKPEAGTSSNYIKSETVIRHRLSNDRDGPENEPAAREGACD